MTKNKWIQDAIKHRGALRKTAIEQGLIKGDEKLSMSDLNKLEKEGGKTAKQASLAKTLRSFADGGVIASNIVMQLGGFSRLQIMLGAYNFVDLKNGISFKIKNARSNYIKITLNGKDLYDIEIGRIRGNTYKVIYNQQDVYATDLKSIIENKTGMYLAFEDGGDVPMDMDILIISQTDKLANGGITALEVLEAREFVGEDDWKKMKPKERLSATRYLVKTGKIGYYEKSKKYADGVQLRKYRVKYLIGYSDEEDALKYHEGYFYADGKDNVALEVFEHFKRLGYSHIEILGIILVADKGMDLKLSDSELNEKYSNLKGSIPNWFKDMPTQYKEEILEEIEEEEFSRGGSIGSKRDNVVNYYINNMEDDVLMDKFDVSEDYLKDRNANYSKIFDIISDNIDDEDISYRFDELNLGEDSEEPDYMDNYKNGGQVYEFKAILRDEYDNLKDKKEFKIKASSRDAAYSKAYKKFPKPYFVELYNSYKSGGFTSSYSGTPDRRRVTKAKGGIMADGIIDYLNTLESNQIFDLCNDFYAEDEEWNEIKNDLDKDDLIQWAYDYCKKNKISLKDLKKLGDEGYYGSGGFTSSYSGTPDKGGKIKDPHPDYPNFVSMQYKKGGALKYYDKETEYKIGRPSGYIEKDILSRVNFSKEDFVGSFGWKTENKKLADGYLYKLSNFDKELVRNIKLKSGEKIFRYFNRTSAIGGMKPLIKINVDKELLYFLKDSDNVEFETRGIQAIWIALIEHKL